VRHNREFRFELTWVAHPDFLPKIQEIWGAPTKDVKALDMFLFRLKKVKQFLKGWGFNLSSSKKKRKQLIQDLLCQLEMIEETCPLSMDQVRQRMNPKVELYNILDEEELVWFKRSHEAWLLKGDNNTEYFYRIANGRKRKQTIFSLHTE
jgi:hypothetical protein